MIRTAFTDLLGCSLPIQQAPMGSISSPRLAVAVAAAGGVGSVSTLGVTARRLATMLDELTSGTSGAVAINFLTQDVDRQLVRMAAERVRLVDFFWSTPDPELVRLVHDNGALVNWQVGSVAGGIAAAEAGVDVVTAQGAEAGGHVVGQVGLLPLLTRLLDEVDVPVLAAGGIVDGRGLAAVLAAGAAGARVGTRFAATTESAAHPEYVQALLDAGDDDTELSRAFDDCTLCASGGRHRVLSSAVTAVEAMDDDVVATVVGRDGDTAVSRRSGMPPHDRVIGDISAMALYAGQSVGGVRATEPGGAVAVAMAEQAERLLRRWN